METERMYRRTFFAGSVWNFATSIALFIFVGSLPSFLGIAEPRYPLFIYFNLMSVFFFGCVQWTIAVHLERSRSFVKILVWAKLTMAAVFTSIMILSPFSKELFGFLVPGIVVDVLFGLAFWRYLFFSRRSAFTKITTDDLKNAFRIDDGRVVI